MRFDWSLARSALSAAIFVAMPEANTLFLDCLTSSRSPELNLRRMNEAGILGKLIPDFGRIVAMMQFSMYHHYTVDEHLLRCLGVLAEIEHGEAEAVHPLSHRLLPEAASSAHPPVCRRPVSRYRQGPPGSARDRRRQDRPQKMPTYGPERKKPSSVAWLVEHHLVMSKFAQSRDLTDRKTIEDFAAIVNPLKGSSFC